MVDMRALVFGASLAISGALATLAACTTDYQKGLEDPRYGGPNALVGAQQPGPTLQESTGASSGASAASPVCVQAGGTLVHGGAPCAVSFKNDILPAFKAASCQTAGSCHGGESPPNQPRIDPDKDPGIWDTFASYKITDGRAYINPCSTDSAQAAIACNVNRDAPCGSQVMPSGVGLDATMVTKIEDWLKCGSPNN